MSSDCPPIEARYGDGWQPIINRLVADLQELDPAIRIVRVREKFGGLRVSAEWPAGTDLDRLRSLVDAARDESSRTCERCGIAGEQRRVGGYWIMTLCSSCNAYAEVAADRYSCNVADLCVRARHMSSGAPVLLETEDGQLLELTMDDSSADAMVQAMITDDEMRWVRAGSPEQRDGALLGGMTQGLILRPYRHGEEGRPKPRPVREIVAQAVTAT
ncbi:hypothetical protein C5U48_02615 [Mycolicibacter virginiensis]|uniref:Uncharacterized protein n=1 Tax=Mycolicibacter virginiensis TaxID=1795032 RepID=A0A9X7P046_9MYCO|nr:hypothetical protein [Mycolicibacter virginiensis]PQM53722.1 hypothetical protein C5U48_02615 [Mycolicibacter virginiensis]